MIRIAIVEDEQEQVRRIQEFLDRYGQEQNVFFQTSVFEDGAKFLFHYQPIYDLVFMDIKLPHLNGLETARTIFSMDRSIGIVFITNMAQYAIKGYEVDALDYIVKPVTYYQFSIKLRRALQKLRKREEHEILLMTDKEMIKIPVADILYVSVDKHTLIYHTRRGEYRQKRSSMSACARDLAEEGFALCNSGCLVNLKHVVSVDSNTVHLAETDEAFVLSRGKRKEFAGQLMTYMRGH